MPDFVNEQGEGFEIKRYDGQLKFTSNQRDKFPELNPYIIIVGREDIKIVKYSNLEETDYDVGSMSKYTASIGVTEETKKEISRIRNRMQVEKDENLTLDDCLKILAKEWENK